MQQTTSKTSNEQILQRVTSEFLQWATSATSNERISQRVKNEFLQQETSGTTSQRILQRVMSYFTTSKEQRMNFKKHRATSEKLYLHECRLKQTGNFMPQFLCRNEANCLCAMSERCPMSHSKLNVTGLLFDFEEHEYCYSRKHKTKQDFQFLHLPQQETKE